MVPVAFPPSLLGIPPEPQFALAQKEQIPGFFDRLINGLANPKIPNDIEPN